MHAPVAFADRLTYPSGRRTPSRHDRRCFDAVFSANAAFSIDATSGSGSVRTENLMVQGETDNRRVTGSLDGGGPDVHLASRSGSITLKSAGH